MIYPRGACYKYADDIALSGTRREEGEKKLEEWRRTMDDRWLKINIKKTVYLRFNGDGNLDGNSDINLQGDNVERVNTFKYLGATLAYNGDLDTEMTCIEYNQDGITGKGYRAFCLTE